MEEIIHTDEKGRKYNAWKDSDDNIIPIGPPEGLVDGLNLPEPFATNLHNALHTRGLFNYRAVSKKSSLLQSALQEALSIDVQRLNEAYFLYEQE